MVRLPYHQIEGGGKQGVRRSGGRRGGPSRSWGRKQRRANLPAAAVVNLGEARDPLEKADEGGTVAAGVVLNDRAPNSDVVTDINGFGASLATCGGVAG